MKPSPGHSILGHESIGRTWKAEGDPSFNPPGTRETESARQRGRPNASLVRTREAASSDPRWQNDLGRATLCAGRTPRATTGSIRQSLPERASLLVIVGASPLRWTLGASPFPSSGSPNCSGFWRLAPFGLTAVSLSLPFGPSPTRLSRHCPLRLATTASADFSLRLLRRRPFRREARSPQVRLRTFPARPPDLRRLTPWSRELRGHLPARPARPRLVSGFCSSARGFAPRFLRTSPRVSPLRFASGRCDQLPQRTFTSKSRAMLGAHLGRSGCSIRRAPDKPHDC